MAFHDVRFPECISYGSRGGPGFNTEIIELDSGQERRLSRWSQPRHRYGIGFGIKSYEDLNSLKRFYLARQGGANSFRYKDFMDFTSSDEGFQVSQGGSPTAFTDQLVAVGDGVKKVFQLVKRYVNGPTTLVRAITKPVVPTVTVAFDTVQQAGAAFFVDSATGRLSFIAAPGAGVQITWGGEFDTHVRFTESTDELLSLQFDDFGSGSSALECVEVIDPSELSGEFHFGGARYAGDAHTFLTESAGRVVVIEPTSGDKNATLPVITADIPPGGPWFYVQNADNTNDVLIKDAGDNLIFTLGPGLTATVLLARISVLTLGWVVF